MIRRTPSVLLAVALLAALAMAGCATTLLYNHADWLIVRQLDGYFDLSRAQKAFVYDRLDGILKRHRHEALPHYEAVAREVGARVRRGLTDQDLAWAFAQYDSLKIDLFGRFASDGAEFVRLVKEPQVARLRGALDARLKHDEDLLHDGVQVRLQTRKDRILSLVRDWLGSITRQQEEEIARLAMNFPDTFPAWYAHQRWRNDRLVDLVESRANGDVALRLYNWLAEQDKEGDPQFVHSAWLFRQHIAQLVLTLDRIATKDQRRFFLNKLDELALTIHRLSRA